MGEITLQERRAELVAALRSGDFKQGTNGLRTHGREVERFCCLGVACEVFRRHHLDLEWKYTDDVHPEFLGDSVYLPDEVREWFSFRTNSGAYQGGGGGSLAYLNDRYTPFAQIADKIENEPTLWETP